MTSSKDESGTESRPAHVVNVDEVDAELGQSPDGRFVVHRKRLGLTAGSRKLGCSWVSVPPGKRTWPQHWHWGNEEAVFVLRGEGTLRLGDREVTIRAGDYVACLCNPEGAHQVYNHSTEPLECLIVSTMVDPDVTVYPDSNKIGIYAGAAPGGPREDRTMDMFLPTNAYVDYWKGEGEAAP